MTSLSRTARRGAPVASLKRSAQPVEIAREGVRELPGSLTVLFEGEHRAERDPPVAGAGQLLGLQLAGVDEPHYVLARESEPAGGLLRREHLPLLGDADGDRP